MRHVIRRGYGVRLLHERFDRAGRCAIELLAGADVPVTCRRMGGLDAEGDDASLGGGGRGTPAGRAEFLRLADHMVGCEHQHEGIAIACGREYGGNRNRGTGIAAHRLQHNIGFHAALAQLLRHHKPEIRVGDDDRTPEQLGIGNALKHLLERRILADEGDELLGHAFARDRPQPCSRAAAHDHRDDLSRH